MFFGLWVVTAFGLSDLGLKEFFGVEVDYFSGFELSVIYGIKVVSMF
jgi:hypothetical protein